MISGGIDFAVEFDPMSVLSNQCDPSFYLSLGSEPGDVFALNTFAWGCGVTDSIRGYGPLDPGSIPGTLTGSSLLPGRVTVADITGVCDALDLGSNPSTPAIFLQKMELKK